MDFKKLTDKAKLAIDKRGGTEALKADLQGLKGVAQGKGTLQEKAKAAAEALKQPGGRTTRTDVPPTGHDVPPTRQDVPPRP